MFFFKNKRMKKTAENNEFLKTCAIKIQGLINIYGGDNAKISEELNTLAEELMFTIPSSDPKAKGYEKSIEKCYEQLAAIFKQAEWEEAEVLALVKEIRLNISELNSLRMTK